jgi:phospholipase C
MKHLPSRRTFLQAVTAAAAAGTMPPAIARALSLPANRRTGTIRDVEHVVVLMQENRSFDHYYGTMRGVRGFGDPRPLLLRSGASVFHQPTPDGKGVVLPFHLDGTISNAQGMASLDHSWKGAFAQWAEYDSWIRHKTPRPWATSCARIFPSITRWPMPSPLATSTSARSTGRPTPIACSCFRGRAG